MNDRVDRQRRNRPPQSGTVRRPVQTPRIPASDLDHPFDAEPVHHRWLLTTCVAGIAGSLVIGSAVLGIFGENAAPRDAYASVGKASLTGAYPDTAEDGMIGAGLGRKELASTYQPQADEEEPIVPERDLNNANVYPEITSDELPYGEGKTVVIDAEIDPVAEEPENITTITKQVPPEPVDESFKMAKG